jgi:hypothetical protein
MQAYQPDPSAHLLRVGEFEKRPRTCQGAHSDPTAIPTNWVCPQELVLSRKYQLLDASTKRDRFKSFVKAMGTPKLCLGRTTRKCTRHFSGWFSRPDAECELSLPEFNITKHEQDLACNVRDVFQLCMRTGDLEDTVVDLSSASHLEVAGDCTIKLHVRVPAPYGGSLPQNSGCQCCTEPCEVFTFIMPSNEERCEWYAAVLDRMMCAHHVVHIEEERARRRQVKPQKPSGAPRTARQLSADQGKRAFRAFVANELPIPTPVLAPASMSSAARGGAVSVARSPARRVAGSQPMLQARAASAPLTRNPAIPSVPPQVEAARNSPRARLAQQGANMAAQATATAGLDNRGYGSYTPGGLEAVLDDPSLASLLRVHLQRGEPGEQSPM